MGKIPAQQDLSSWQYRHCANIGIHSCARGKAVLQRAVKIAGPIAIATWKGVTEEERKTLAAIVTKVLNNLKQMGPEEK